MKARVENTRLTFCYDAVMAKEVVLLIGPPGSGKGTQANLLQDEKGYFHLETSRLIEENFKKAPDDPVLAREKENWATGKLVSTKLVMGWLLGQVRELAAQSRSIVFSGSPRTREEAEEEIPIFEELYGPLNIHVLHLSVPEERSVQRNSARRICKANRHPIPADYAGATCPEDGSELVTRELDDKPDIIRVRLKEYAKRTEPVLAYLRDRGYTVVDINADNTIEAVHHAIINAIELRRPPVPEQ
jgi:adenylate kinase